MRKIDFLSQSPKNFIFQKKSNKNTVGGIFTFLLIIIFLLIFFYYRVKFAFSNQYDITSFISQEKTISKHPLFLYLWHFDVVGLGYPSAMISHHRDAFFYTSWQLFLVQVALVP